MPIEDTAKVVLSGEHSRRRGYLSSIHTTWDGLALTGTLAIWAFLVQWDTLGGAQPDHELFATQIAWASALSSLLLGFWRLYARNIDDSIVSLYPVMYLCERAIVPSEACTFNPPAGKQTLSQNDLSHGLAWVKVRNRDFGGRGHSVLDWIAAVLIAGFAAINVFTGSQLRVIRIMWFGIPHLIGWLLLGNVVGLALVLWGWLWWRNRERNWPIPESRPANQDQDV